MRSEADYARLGDNRIAYRVIGNAPRDLVFLLGSFSHIDIVWEEPGAELFLRMLSSFCRVIVFDRLGTGASDPLPLDALPPWEAYAEELATVLDAAGSRQAAILAHSDAGPMALYFAATRPERTSALILVHTSAKYIAADDYPEGLPPDVAETFLAQVDQVGHRRPGRAAHPQQGGRRAVRPLVRQGAANGREPTDRPGLPAGVDADRRAPVPATRAGADADHAPAGLPDAPAGSGPLSRRPHRGRAAGRAPRRGLRAGVGDAGACARRD